MNKIFNSIIATAIAAFTFGSCADVPEPYTIPNNGGTTTDDTKTYINETFASSLGDFTNISEEGTAAWANNASYKCAVATGYINTTNTAAKSWLVSPKIDLTGEDSAYISFSHAIGYEQASSVNDNHKLYISKDFSGGVKTATWKELNVTMPDSYTSGGYEFVTSSTNIPTDYLTSNVTIALKYTSTETKASTWEVKNFIVKHGQVSQSTTPDTTIAAAGDGTKASPYNVTAAIAKATATNVWVKGYIVGYIYGKSISSGSVFSADTCTVQTNALIAASANETDYTKCMPVKLPTGDIRTGINLSQNKGNYKKEVFLYGSIGTYFGTAGVIDITCAIIGTTTLGTDPTVTPTETTKYTKVTTIADGTYLIAALNGTSYEVAQPLSSAYGYIKATARTATDNVISTEVATAFTITKTENGYTIMDANNKYIYMSGTYNSFNVDAAPTAGQYWDIAANSDGTFTITNKSTSKWIQYSTSYTSYGAYNTTKGINPCLFKK